MGREFLFFVMTMMMLLVVLVEMLVDVKKDEVMKRVDSSLRECLTPKNLITRHMIKNKMVVMSHSTLRSAISIR